jgi:hypothetical protein
MIFSLSSAEYPVSFWRILKPLQVDEFAAKNGLIKVECVLGISFEIQIRIDRCHILCFLISINLKSVICCWLARHSFCGGGLLDAGY